MPLYLILSLVFLAHGTPATAPSSGLALLNSVADRYAQAKSYHVEAIKEQTTQWKPVTQLAKDFYDGHCRAWWKVPL